MERISQKNFLILALSILIGILFLFTFFYLNIGKQEKKSPLKSPSPTVISASPTEAFYISPASILNDDPGFTGANLDEGLPENETQQINQAFELRQKLPFKTEDFLMEYDYNKARFVVVLKGSQEAGKAKLRDWLKSNNFASIPEDKFVYKTE